MTRIDFYLLDADRPGSREIVACRLADKAWQQGHRVYLNAADPAQAGRIDELLWTWRAGSFVPHELLLAENEPDPTVPVQIGSGLDPAGHADVLINLAPEVPLWFSRFERLAEVIDENDEVKAKGRERFRFYRERGYPLNTHTIGAE